MKQVEKTIIENKALLLGDNFFETGSIELGRGEEIKEGAFLKRGEEPKSFELVKVIGEDGDEPIAIVPVAMKK